MSVQKADADFCRELSQNRFGNLLPDPIGLNNYGSVLVLKDSIFIGFGFGADSEMFN